MSHPLRQQLARDVNSVGQGYLYHDEPQMFSFVAEASSRVRKNAPFLGVGTSLNRNRALMKAQGEALERRALAEIAISGVKAKGIDLSDKTSVLIPMQLVAVPYMLRRGEKILRESNSSGAALGKDVTDATLRGLHELVERDAFLRSYHMKLAHARLLCDRGSAELRDLLSECKRCRLTVTLLDITSDIGPYVVLAVVTDASGLGVPLSAGLKAGPDIQRTALNALEEAIQTRLFVKNLLLNGIIPVRTAKNNIRTIAQRASYWLDPQLLKKLRWHEQIPVRDISSYPRVKYSLVSLVKKLKKLGDSPVVVDLSNRTMRNYKVVKVVSHVLQPLYLSERHSVIFPERVGVIDPIPHYFL